MGKAGWPEGQVRAAVRAYFDLLGAETKGEVRNKTELFRSLVRKHRARTAKAFELKFQNISAILYEERLPYCSGIKPKFNYQRLLKLVVLEHLRRTAPPAQEPHLILAAKLGELHRRGYLRVLGNGTGRFGLTLEHHLGIRPNSDKLGDFMGIELKTKHDQSLQTLFSRVPTRFTGCRDRSDLVERHGYTESARGRRALYTSFSSRPDSLGFALRARRKAVAATRHGVTLFEYDVEELEAALLSKHSHTAYVALATRRGGRGLECRIESARYCKWPSILRFLKLVKRGDVYLDLTLAMRRGVVRDHGFLWRLRTDALEDLYLSSQSLVLR